MDNFDRSPFCRGLTKAPPSSANTDPLKHVKIIYSSIEVVLESVDVAKFSIHENFLKHRTKTYLLSYTDIFIKVVFHLYLLISQSREPREKLGCVCQKQNERFVLNLCEFYPQEDIILRGEPLVNDEMMFSH